MQGQGLIEQLAIPVQTFGESKLWGITENRERTLNNAKN